jgi:hypothetical protein
MQGKVELAELRRDGGRMRRVEGGEMGEVVEKAAGDERVFIAGRSR